MRFRMYPLLAAGVVLSVIGYLRGGDRSAFYILGFALWIVGVYLGLVRR